MNKHSIHNQSGVVLALVVAGVLPVLFVLFSVTLDVATYYSRTKKLQKIADETVLFAERYLPYEEAAREALMSMLGTRGVLPESIGELYVDSTTIDVILRERYQIFFAELVGLSDGIPLVVRAQSLSVPLDIALVMDIGSSLSPTIPVGSRWDQNQEAARFFEDYPRRFINSAGIEEPIDAVIATQQCFNSLFSKVKEGTLNLVQYLTHTDKNNLSLAFFPGAYSSITMSPYVSTGEPAVSPLHYSRYQGTYTAGDLCAAASIQQEETQSLLYRFPTFSGLHQTWEPPLGAGVMVHPHTYPHIYNTEYDQYLTLSEAIWAQSTTESTHLDFQEAIAYLQSVLLAQQPNERRRNLMNRGIKLGFLILGDYPRDAQGVRFPHGQSATMINQALDQMNEFAEVANQRIELSIILIHPGNNTFSGYPQEFSPADTGALSALMKRSASSHNGLNSRFFSAELDELGSLNNAILQQISRLSSRSVLGR